MAIAIDGVQEFSYGYNGLSYGQIVIAESVIAQSVAIPHGHGCVCVREGIHIRVHDWSVTSVI